MKQLGDLGLDLMLKNLGEVGRETVEYLTVIAQDAARVVADPTLTEIDRQDRLQILKNQVSTAKELARIRANKESWKTFQTVVQVGIDAIGVFGRAVVRA
jgi:hypothetical protein